MQGDTTQPWHGTPVASSSTSTWLGEPGEAEVGLGTPSHPAGHRDREDAVGAQGVGVLLLALPVQCQGAGAGSHPGREVQGADGAGTTLRTPSPLPTELPQGSTVLGAHLRCHLHWVPPPCPACLEDLATVRA